LQTLVLFLLMLNVRSDDLLIGTYCGDKIAPRPELVTDKVSLLVGDILSDPDRTLAFETSHYRRHTVFGGNGNEHMYMSWHEMTRFDRAFFLLCQAVKHLSQVPSDHPIEDFLSVLGSEDDVVLAIPSAMVQVMRDGRHGRSPVWNASSGRNILGDLPHM
jgi:hypothetical protein